MRNIIEISTVEPRFNEPLFNEVLVITNSTLCPGQNYSKMYGVEPRYNEHNPTLAPEVFLWVLTIMPN